jgi:hypothetical protein
LVMEIFSGSFSQLTYNQLGLPLTTFAGTCLTARRSPRRYVPLINTNE